jgi:hypothetical protein
MCKRRRDKSQERSISPSTADVIVISIREMVALVEIFEHAHIQIAELSEANRKTISSASGSALIPSLYARAGLASSGGRGGIPLLASEVGLLEAAVINLESYEGNEVVLCAGYELLDSFAHRMRNVYPLSRTHGILTFVYEAGGSTSGSATPSAPDGGGPELVS